MHLFTGLSTTEGLIKAKRFIPYSSTFVTELFDRKSSTNFWKHLIYQIKQPYYMDCGTSGRQPGEDVTTSYHDHYKGGCPSSATDPCEAMARLHNGGPKECEKPSTLDYLKDIVKLSDTMMK
ncbi:unnamed protein product [Angiostrongylus costaricensis]|uniref:Lysozyme n=1 Tax=Angiostrongylus costaricensis TaxID=334426 RepID=A0A0R3Q1G2_ANGCS|nr:unnamed protein product [Angiostrongylus costaricensis]